MTWTTERRTRVSIIIPAFNYGRYLPATLDSVLAQSLPHWECIIVDDGSTDDTRIVALRYVSSDARFAYLYQENKGPSATRNAGLMRAKGDYIQLLDADDLIESEKLSEQMKFLEAHPECAVVYGPTHYFRIKNDGKRKKIACQGYIKEYDDMFSQESWEFRRLLLEGNVFAVSAPLFRKNLLAKIGFFDESLPSHEDWDFWLRVALAGERFARLDVPQAGTQIREHNKSLTRKGVVMAETRLAVRRRVEEATNDEKTLIQNRIGLSYDKCMLGAAYIKTGHLMMGLGVLGNGFFTASNKLRAIRLFMANAVPEWVLSTYRYTRYKILSLNNFSGGK